MSLESVAQIRVDPNVRCQRIYPVEGSQKQVSQLKTVGLVLTPEQAIHLARALLVAAQQWDEIGVTAYRLRSR